MGRHAIKPEEWWSLAAALMVKHNLSLREAAQELGIDLSIAEADTLSKRVLFKDCLEQAKTDYYTEIGPRISKEQIEGLLFALAERLAADREDAKASEALLRLAKVKGIVGYEPDSLQKVLSSLTQSDIDELKRRLKNKQQAQSREADTAPSEVVAEFRQVN